MKQSSFVAHAVREFGQGDLISYAHLQPDLKRLETSFGLWSYRDIAGMTVTLGGPLCSNTDRPKMIELLLQKKKRPILLYLKEDLLPFLKDSPLFCTGIGVDRIPDVPTLLEKPSKKVIGALKKSVKAGISCEEAPTVLDNNTQKIIQDISQIYLQRSQCSKEMSFLNMPFKCTAAPERRLFLIREKCASILGFAYLNPIYHNGRCRSYLLDMLRFRPTKVWGLWLSTVYTLAKYLAAEDCDLSLGFCPLHLHRKTKNNSSRLLNAQMSLMSKSFSSSQYLTQLRTLKEEIPGFYAPRYLASFTRLAPINLYAFTEAMGVGIETLWGPDLFRVLRKGWTTRSPR